MSRRPGDQIVKDPASDEPEGFDWTTYLGELGVGIIVNTSTWAIAGPDSALTKHDESILSGSLKTQLYLAGGTAGATYTVTNHIVTNSAPPVVDERSFQVLVENR